MTVWRLIGKEILHRKLNFALAVLSVLVAVGVLVAGYTLLVAHDLRTEQMLAAKQAEAHKRLAVMEDDYRKYMKELGFNLLILPKQQDLAEFWEQGYASTTMPEENVRTLADSNTNLIRHLLPIVQQKVRWPEQKRRVILIGTRGEVPLAHRRPKEPILLAVPIGKAVVGHQLAVDLELKVGDTIRLLGRDFVIHQCHPRRGSADDATIWVDLKAGQELLQMPGRINAIEALKCKCEDVTPEHLMTEVSGHLNNTVKVVLRENRVTLRKKARDRATIEHEQAMAAEKASRNRLRQTRESLAGVLVPVVVLGAAVWIGLLALGNVRERSAEIGILRAIGVRSASIFSVFLTKAVLVGLIGAVIGYAAGLGVGLLTAHVTDSLRLDAAGALLSPSLLAAVVVAAPLLSVLASWAPATLAGRQDPAMILSKE